MIDPVLVVGVAVVLPFALGGPGRWWVAAAGSVAVALALPAGPWAALFAVPWLLVVAACWEGRLAGVYAAMAAGAFVQSRLGVVLLDVGEPFVELAAVHFTYAGAGALVLAERARAAVSGEAPRLAATAVRFTAAAPPFVALGFLTGHAAPQVGGAVLMTVGVWATAALHLRMATHRPVPSQGRVLLVVSGLAPWVPMVLAVAWAAGQYWDAPSLSVPDMARAHGLANAFGFTVCGLLAGGVSPSGVGRVLAAAERADPTYDHVGSTLASPTRRARSFELDVGRGPADFDAAVDALCGWRPQRRIGARVHPGDVVPAPGATVVVDLGLGPFRLFVPNRVVAVVEEADRFAFAYGTLPGHPERGEESFEVRLLDDGTVRCTVSVEAEPTVLLLPLAPLLGVAQRAVIGRYLRAVADHVDRSREGSLP